MAFMFPQTRDAKIVNDALNMYTETLKLYCKPGDEHQIKREKTLRQISYRTIVEGGIKLEGAEMSKIEAIQDLEERKKYVKKKFSSAEKMLLTLDSGRVSVHTVKLKD